MAVLYSLFSFAAKPWLPVLLIIAFLLCVLAVVGKGCYNRYFHPLSSYPGPFWASVTDFYILFTIKSIPTRGLKMHDKYGWWLFKIPKSRVHTTDYALRAYRAHRPEPVVILGSCTTSKGLSRESRQDTILQLLAFRKYCWNVPNARSQGSCSQVQNRVSMRKPASPTFFLRISINSCQ